MQRIYSFALVALFLFGSCATYKPQYKNKNSNQTFPTQKEIAHSFYLIGDAGNSEQGQVSEALKAFQSELEKASKNSTAIFLGDNIYERGFPDKSKSDRDLAKYRLKVQVDAVKNFKGSTVFIPGNHDWYSGIKGLKRQEKYIEDKLGKDSFLPESGCPIDKIHVSDDIELILIDSHWYVTNWDKIPTINDNCDIKTRARFLDEFSDLIKKARGKTTIIALHHPMFSNGTHGGQYTFGNNLSPLPVLGNLKNIIRKTGGISTTDLQNIRYNELKTRLVTLAQNNKKVVFVSGHEHSLQYIVEDNLRQIISGSGSKVTATRNVGGGLFSYGTQGYARLDVFKDGSSHARFYSVKDKKIVYQTEVLEPNEKIELNTYPNSFPKEVLASIYTKKETEKTGFFKFLWGERYRDYYSTKVKAKTVKLDTLFGGLTPIRKGGGNQSKSLRLKDKNGAQYVMRALRKNAVQYLQAIVFKDQYIEGQFDDTSIENLLLDVFTGAHPYAPFVVGTLADGAKVFHTNPVLYYVPKQNALGHFNSEFGNELYMIEEHTSKGHSDQASFGYQDKLVNSEDMMKKIHKDEDIVIDEESYIRARLFDMLIGDWDRHSDQWRWIEFKENGKKVYRPMPRDRDQAFSKMSDGFLLNTAVTLVPAAKLLRKYDDDLVDVKGMNVEPYPLDMELIQRSDKKVWDAQVKLIQEGVTDEVIEKAFMFIPEELRTKSIAEIKQKLKARRSNLQAISDRYFKVINRYAVIKGTNKDDWFEVERMSNGRTKITAYRIKDKKKSDVFHERVYSKPTTREIWIYGLDDDDVFHVHGDGDQLIQVRLIGGQNNDTYNIENGKTLIYYDYQSKNNTIVTKKGRKKFREDYETNVYDYKKLKNNTNSIIPKIGFNPDDGVRVGIADTFTSYGFERNPFTSQHTISAEYYFATSGFVLGYSSEIANVFKGVNLGINAHFNSPNYAVNFFGFGNETPNPEADEDDGLDVDLDYNRVKIRTFSIRPSLVWKGQSGSNFYAGLLFESNKVERTENRFISTFSPMNELFDKQDFYGIDMKYEFVNKNNKVFPTLGLMTAIQAGYKNNINSEKGFGYIIPEIAFDYKLGARGKVVLATHIKGHVNLGDEFEFYQAASIGANNGLRGYRNERFTGKNAFFQSTDIRWNFTNMKTGLMPVSIGVYGGVDYGRVWLDNDNSDKWNNSFGGGLFVNFAGLAAGNLSAFNSDDGLRIAFRLGFGF